MKKLAPLSPGSYSFIEVTNSNKCQFLAIVIRLAGVAWAWATNTKTTISEETKTGNATEIASEYPIFVFRYRIRFVSYCKDIRLWRTGSQYDNILYLIPGTGCNGPISSILVRIGEVIEDITKATEERLPHSSTRIHGQNTEPGSHLIYIFWIGFSFLLFHSTARLAEAQFNWCDFIWFQQKCQTVGCSFSLRSHCWPHATGRGKFVPCNKTIDGVCLLYHALHTPSASSHTIG